MGNCCGPATPEQQRNQQVEAEIEQDKLDGKSLKKLLLLGAGGSGKSTFFKQLQCIHASGFNQQERVSYKSQICEQIITQMQILIDKCALKYAQDPTTYVDLQIRPESEAVARRITKELRAGMEVTQEVADMITQLWEDPAMKAGYEIRHLLCVFDTTNYFFDEVQRVAQPDYVPTEKDILFVRHRTTGMNQKDFTIKGTKFQIVDVGGQRSERRKWIHFFTDVTGVVFVASLSCYNEVLYEDETVNVMHETLQVFMETCNSHYFQTTSFILFLNKRDLFEYKLLERKEPITIAFPEYDGPADDVDACIKHIEDDFESKNANEEEREFYIHVTCATDRGNVEKVFNDVQHMIVNKSLAKSGLL